MVRQGPSHGLHLILQALRHALPGAAQVVAAEDGRACIFRAPPGSWRRPEYARSAIFRSDNLGRSWQRVTKGLEDEMEPMAWALANHPTDPNSAFAGIGRVSRGS